MPSTNAIPKSLLAGRYEIQSLIGAGHTSEVYLGFDRRQYSKVVAIKILKRNAARDEETVLRFDREVQLTQQLSHPNIIRVHSAGRTPEGLPYLVMDYVDRGTLGDMLRARSDHKLPFIRAINVIRSIASALAHAHERGVIHRDLKPDNILLSSNGGVKLADFGVGRSEMFEPNLTGAQSIGTPFYMSPEQIGAKPASPASDVYSLGIVSYEIVMGERPYPEDCWYKLAFQHCEGEFPPLSVKGAGIPCWFESIVYRAVEKDPKDRFPNAKAFLAEVDRLAEAHYAASTSWERFREFFKPDGVLCSYLSDKGYSRKRIGLLLLALLAASVALLLRF